jgi:hypothetical protein
VNRDLLITPIFNLAEVAYRQDCKNAEHAGGP